MEDENEELLLAAKDFDKLESSHLKEGFREGSAKGHDLSLQQSFELGFSDGVRKRILLGQLLGCLNALKVSYERDNRSIDEIKQLIKEAESCKEDEMKCIANSTNSSVQQVIDSIQQPHELSELFHKYKSLLK